MFGANYLTILLKPNYEKPVDSPEDIIDRGLTVIWPPGWEDYKDMLMNDTGYGSREINTKLAENTEVAKVIFCYTEKLPFNFFFKNWSHFDKLIQDLILKDGKAVIDDYKLTNLELKWAKENYDTAWHRSKDIREGGDMNFASYMLNKKWALEEEFNNHMLRFQQVRGVYLFQ